MGEVHTGFERGRSEGKRQLGNISTDGRITFKN
jgi:hypothetical protein